MLQQLYDSKNYVKRYLIMPIILDCFRTWNGSQNVAANLFKISSIEKNPSLIAIRSKSIKCNPKISHDQTRQSNQLIESSFVK